MSKDSEGARKAEYKGKVSDESKGGKWEEYSHKIEPMEKGTWARREESEGIEKINDNEYEGKWERKLNP